MLISPDIPQMVVSQIAVANHSFIDFTLVIRFRDFRVNPFILNHRLSIEFDKSYSKDGRGISIRSDHPILEDKSAKLVSSDLRVSKKPVDQWRH